MKVDNHFSGSMRYLAVLLTSITLFASLPITNALAGASWSVRSKISSDKAKLQQKSQEKSQVDSQIRQADAIISAINSGIVSLESDLSITRDKIQSTRSELVRLRQEYDVKRKELAVAKREMVRLNRVLNERARSFYRTGKVSMVEVVLESRSFGELLHRVNFLGKMVDYDAQLVTEIKRTKGRIEAASQQIDANRATAEQQQASLLNQEQHVQGLIVDRKQQQNKLQVTLADKRKVLSRLGGEEQQLKAEISAEEADAARLEAMERTGGYSFVGTPSASGFVWPAAGTVTGEFGESRPGHIHAGIDIANSEGTPIVASKAGVVIYAGWMSGYGNVIDIDHGGGVKTRYGHNSALLVSGGQSVSQGQQIARMGSTGHSTGPHCHYEIRLNGNAVNPRNYLPEKDKCSGD